MAVDDAADQQQQQKTEAANTLLITQLLEQLVSLQDLDEALILVRSHRVLHQVGTPLVSHFNHGMPRIPDAHAADGRRYRARVPYAVLPHWYESAVCRAQQRGKRSRCMRLQAGALRERRAVAAAAAPCRCSFRPL